MTFAGTPPTIVFGSTSFVTTAPAATTAPLPMYCRPIKTAGNGIIESVHVVRKKTLADGSQGGYLLFTACHNLRFTNGRCRLIL